MKKGFTLVEILVSTAILGLLTISAVPFIIQATKSQDNKIMTHNEYIQEFSDINRALGAKTLSEFLSADTERIKIIKEDQSKRLYKVEGEKTGVYSYWVVKE